MTTRPASKRHTWAETSTYPSGGAGITGTATALEPSDAIKGYGNIPGNPIGARRRNWLDRQGARWAGYHDGIEALNWGRVAWVGSNAYDAEMSLCTDSFGRTFFAIEDNIYVTFAGQNWGAKTVAGIAQNFRCIASAGDIVVAGGDAQAVVKTYVSSTNTGFANHDLTAIVPATFEARAAVGFGDYVYIGGGVDVVPGVYVPRIVRISQALASTLVMSDSLLSGFAPGCIVSLMAASPTLIVALAWDIDVTTPAFWTSSDGTTWTLTRPTFSDTWFTDLHWNATDEAFELMAINGDIWTSTNGTVWSLRMPYASVPLAPGGQPNSLALAGGLWVCVNNGIEDEPRLCLSLDRGETWECLHYTPFDEIGTYADPQNGIAVWYSGGRFWAAQRPTNPTDPYSLIASMRIEV